MMAYCLNDLGEIACVLEEYTTAKGHYRASYAIKKEFDDPEGMAVALNHLGEVALREEHYTEANQLYEQSLAIYREIRDRGEWATSFEGLANTALRLGRYEAARDYFQEALQIAVDAQIIPLLLSILAGIGELLIESGQHERALDVLHLIRHHPASDEQTKERVQQRLADWRARVAGGTSADATKDRGGVALEGTVAKVQADLAALEASPDRSGRLRSQPAEEAEQALVDPLTPRELEILRLLANGLSNRAIAEELVIAVGTVKAHNHSIYSKLGVNNRTAAVVRARELDLV